MLPFKFEIEGKLEAFQKELQKIGWKASQNKIEKNEKLYYYNYVTDIIHSSKKEEEEQALYYYEYPLGVDEKYNFYVQDTLYSLDLKKVSLRVFALGVAILSFHIENHQYDSLQEINIINDFGKRIYPQFEPIKEAKKAFLASKFEVLGEVETFGNFDIENRMPNFIRKVLPKDEKFEIDPIVDDRMFVICWHENDEMERLQKYHEPLQRYEYETNGEWYKYVFCDGQYLTCQSKKLLESLIENHTYDRWVEFGSLYGLSCYSFMLMTTKNPPPYLPRHMETIYFQMMVIVFMNKATVLKFAKEIADISNEISNIESSEDNEQVVTRISKLYQRYIEFVNRYYFREITAQKQGIELYTQMKTIMDIDVAVKNLGAEINELYQFAALVKEKESTQEMAKLTEVATYFLPATLVVGIFGMNTFSKESINIESMPWLLSSLALVILSIFFFQRYSEGFSNFIDKWNLFKLLKKKKDASKERYTLLNQRYEARKTLKKGER
jgi:hypothetical protein